ncbi:MAG: hypothetical protein COA78_15455 [Blastopirellula sp.]|nr:MAG: hypothetical protein COA78_15455 [Blastopirellula sp.]
MVVVTAISLVFAHYGMTLVESEKEQFSGAALEYMGLDVRYYYIGPKWISRITGSDPYIDSLMGVRGVRIPYDASDDKIQATIVVLGTLHHVKWLDCNMNPALTDNRLAEFLQLPSLASLEDLSFHGTSVTGTAFSKAAHLTNLREVWASNTRINDRTLPLISSIGRIEELWLNDTKIGENSMKHILEMPYLSDFRAFRTGIRPSMCISLEARGVTCYVSEKIDSLEIGEQIRADAKKWREEWGEKRLEEQRLKDRIEINKRLLKEAEEQKMKELNERRLKELQEQQLQELEQFQSKDLDEELQLEIDEGLFLELEEL